MSVNLLRGQKQNTVKANCTPRDVFTMFRRQRA